MAMMDTFEKRDSLRSSWQDVQQMPDQADAAQGSETEKKQEDSGTNDSPVELPGAQDAGSQPKESYVVHEDLEWIMEDNEYPAVSDQECFEGEAEVVQEEYKDENKGLRFEEEDSCVHASKPDSDAVAPVEFDNASERDPEASSLAGSAGEGSPEASGLASLDCEYALVLNRPNANLPGMGEEAKATPDKGRRVPQFPIQSPMSPKQGPQSPSLQLVGQSTPQVARCGNQSPAQSPAPPCLVPPFTEGAGLAIGLIARQPTQCGARDTRNAASTHQAGAQSTSRDAMKTEGMATQKGDHDEVSSRESGPPQGNAEVQSGQTSREEQKDEEDSLVQAFVKAEPEDCTVPTLLHIAAEELARQRRRQLDAVGVIPGGRAAFGAKLPADDTASARRSTATVGRQLQQHEAAERPASAALPELARPAAPDWPRPRGRWPGSSGGLGRPAAPAALLRRLQARPGATLEGRRAPTPARRAEARALEGTMLECYDFLWHGSSCVVASQS